MTASQIAPSTPSAPGRPLPGRLGPRSWRPALGKTSPSRLRAQAAAALLAILALCGVTVAAAVDVSDDVHELSRVAAVRAAAAEQLYFDLADLDAQRANALIPGHAADHPDLLVGNKQLAQLTAIERRSQINDLVQELAADSEARSKVHNILDSLARYDSLSGQAGYLDDQQWDREAGHPPVLAVSFSGQASDVMHHHLLPDVNKLAKGYVAKATHLGERTHSTAVRAAVTVAAVGAVVLAVLLWFMRDLATRYRRRLNPALLVATACTLAITIAGAVTFAGAAADVHSATRDGLRPWSRLVEARALAADAAAHQSRWLVDDPGAATIRRSELDAITGEVRALLNPAGQTASSATEHTLEKEVRDRYGNFQRDDQNLVSLVEAGRLDEATEVLTEVARGHVAFDFYDFSTRLNTLIDLQQADFARDTGTAGAALDGWPAIPLAVLGLAVIAVLGGVRPRLAEYR